MMANGAFLAACVSRPDTVARGGERVATLVEHNAHWEDCLDQADQVDTCTSFTLTPPFSF